jgi:hypothetical protein
MQHEFGNQEMNPGNKPLPLPPAPAKTSAKRLSQTLLHMQQSLGSAGDTRSGHSPAIQGLPKVCPLTWTANPVSMPAVSRIHFNDGKTSHGM